MKSIKIIGALGMLLGLCLHSQAIILVPGEVGMAGPQAPGPAPITTLITAYAFGNLNGTVMSWVTRDPANPFGGLSFYYQINNTGPEEVTRITSSDFGVIPGSLVLVNTISDPYPGSIPGGLPPTEATRSAGAGSVVGFDFPGRFEIEGGEHSQILVVNTAYQTFRITPGAIIDNNSFNIFLLGPGLVQTPEPATIVAASLLLIPLGASALRMLRKRQNVTG